MIDTRELITCPVCKCSVPSWPATKKGQTLLISWHTRGIGMSKETGLPIERRRCPGSNCSIAAAEAVANDE